MDLVEQEIRHLQTLWQHSAASQTTGTAGDTLLGQYLSASQIQNLDRFDRVQLEDVLRVCQESATLSDAGRTLFAASRRDKKTPNDADRLRKYLARFGLAWDDLRRST